MYHINDNNTFGKGTNHGGGATITVYAENTDEANDLYKINARSLRCVTWTWQTYFLEKKISLRNVSHAGGVPQDGGANPAVKKLKELLIQQYSVKISPLSELNNAPGVERDPIVSEMISESGKWRYYYQPSRA